VLLAVPKWNSREELHQHVLHFPFVRSLTTILLVVGLGVEEQRNRFREVPMLRLVIDFCGGSAKEEVYLRKPKMEEEIRGTLSRFLLAF